MSREIPAPFLDAWRALLRAHAAAIGRIEGDLQTAGSVPLTSYDVLLELSRAPGRRLRMAELAERVVLSRSGLTRLVDRLERDGLVRREACPDDRRGMDAVLAEEGLAALREAWPVYAAGIAQHFARHLNREEAEVVARALERVANAPSVERAAGDGGGPAEGAGS